MSIPCITLRENTERPETVSEGTNILVGEDFHKLSAMIKQIKRGFWKSSSIPKLWDGHTGERILEVLCKLKQQ